MADMRMGAEKDRKFFEDRCDCIIENDADVVCFENKAVELIQKLLDGGKTDTNPKG